MTFTNTNNCRNRTAAPMKAQEISVRPSMKIPSGIANIPDRITVRPA
jgi:hypothetical protein